MEQIPARLLTEWMAYDRVEPFGEWRADLRVAMLAALYANAHRGKDAAPLGIDDFMPSFYRPPEAPDDDDQPDDQPAPDTTANDLALLEAWVEALNVGLGGTDLRSQVEETVVKRSRE